MSLKIPAIRSKMGIWFYYVSSLSFKEVSRYVRPIDDELHHSDLLSGMIQRSITSNYKSIANYLETQSERFFNSLILAVYDGQPKWNEIRIEDEQGEDNYNLGVITLTDDVKIFPVDGQHRVAGIKKAIEDNPTMEEERVPVIFIGHSKDETGMQRTRRMFSTLNRYAKPVSLRDIIALDEDDVVAIASRNLLDNTDLFVDGRILDSKNKSIPETNDMALTTIITYYECNKELLWLYVKDIDVEKNTVVLARDSELYSDRLIANDINLISVDKIDKPMEVTAKIRYRHTEAKATVTQISEDEIEVVFKEPQRAITKGQAVVLYKGDIVVGGGTIC